MSRKKTNLEYVSNKEYVNPKRGICVSVLTFRINLNKLPEYDNMLWDYEPLRKYINTLDCRNNPNDIREEYVYWTVRGKSICGKNDTFNEELGKHIALTRAQEKAFNVVGRFYMKLFYIISNNLLTKYNTLLSNSFSSSQKESEHVDKLTGVENPSNETLEPQTI